MYTKGIFLPTLLFVTLFFLALPIQAFAVNSLSFDAISKNGNVGDTIRVGTMISATDEVISADVKITYDTSAIEILSTEAGDFFKDVSQSTSTPGTLTLTALQEGTKGKKGSGVVAYTNMKFKKSGSSQLKFLCSSTNPTSKLIINATTASNAIDCASTGAQVLGISVGTAGAPTPTPAPGSVTPTASVPVGTVVQPGAGQPYSPGGVYTTPPTRLPQSGAVEDTIHVMIFGGLFVALGTLLRKYVYN